MKQRMGPKKTGFKENSSLKALFLFKKNEQLSI